MADWYQDFMLTSPDSGEFGPVDLFSGDGMDLPSTSSYTPDVNDYTDTGFDLLDGWVYEATPAVDSFWEKLTTGASSIWDSISESANKLFMTPDTTDSKTDATKGGGLNTLGQTLLAGALQGISQSSLQKWQAERAAKENKLTREASAAENAKQRAFDKQQQDERYSRAEYGGSPSLGRPRRGSGILSSGEAI